MQLRVVFLTIFLASFIFGYSQIKMGFDAGTNATAVQYEDKSQISEGVYPLRFNSLERTIFIESKLGRSNVGINFTGGSQAIRVQYKNVSSAIDPNNIIKHKYNQGIKFESFNIYISRNIFSKNKIRLTTGVSLGYSWHSSAEESGRIGGVNEDSIRGFYEHSTSYSLSSESVSLLLLNTYLKTSYRLNKKVEIFCKTGFTFTNSTPTHITSNRRYFESNENLSETYLYRANSRLARLNLNIGMSFDMKTNR